MLLVNMFSSFFALGIAAINEGISLNSLALLRVRGSGIICVYSLSSLDFIYGFH